MYDNVLNKLVIWLRPVALGNFEIPKPGGVLCFSVYNWRMSTEITPKIQYFKDEKENFWFGDLAWCLVKKLRKIHQRMGSSRATTEVWLIRIGLSSVL